METTTKDFSEKTVNTINIISNLCYDIQRKGIATVFVDYSGHCNILHIRLFSGVWDSDNSEINQTTNVSIDHISLDYQYKPERISVLINYLQNCILANKVLIPSRFLLQLY